MTVASPERVAAPPHKPAFVALKAGGYVGIVDAAVAWYLSAALMLLQTTGRQLLPIWPYSPKA